MEGLKSPDVEVSARPKRVRVRRERHNVPEMLIHENPSPLTGLLLLVVLYWFSSWFFPLLNLLTLPYTCIYHLAASTTPLITSVLSFIAPVFVYGVGIYTLYQYITKTQTRDQ